MILGKPNRLERCQQVSDDEVDTDRTTPLVRNDQQDFLTEKQQLDSRDYREKFLTWLLKIGKEPTKAAGYSRYTVSATANRCARFDLRTWNQRGGYVMPPTEEDAVDYMETVAYRDVTESTKGKTLEAIIRYSDWISHKFGYDEWEFQWTFQSGGGNTGPRLPLPYNAPNKT